MPRSTVAPTFLGDLPTLPFHVKRETMLLAAGLSVLLGFLCGCASVRIKREDLARHRVRSIYPDSISTYKSFLEDYSDGFHADSARLLIQEMVERKAKMARKVHAVVQLNGMPADSNIPYYKDFVDLLQCSGLQPTSDSESADITLRIDEQEEAWGAYYTDGRFHYTAANVRGWLAFGFLGATSRAFGFSDSCPLSNSIGGEVELFDRQYAIGQALERADPASGLVMLICAVRGESALLGALNSGGTDLDVRANIANGFLRFSSLTRSYVVELVSRTVNECCDSLTTPDAVESCLRILGRLFEGLGRYGDESALPALNRLASFASLPGWCHVGAESAIESIRERCGEGDPRHRLKSDDEKKQHRSRVRAR